MDKQNILQQVSKEANRKSLAMNTLVQLLALYTDPESHSRPTVHSRTDGQTDDIMMPIADHSTQDYWYCRRKQHLRDYR